MRQPPRKRAGQARIPRRIGGELLDVRETAALLGVTPKMIRARVARRQIPFHRWGGRIVFRNAELETYIAALDGCSVEEALRNVTEI